MQEARVRERCRPDDGGLGLFNKGENQHMAKRSRPLVAIDIGTTKITALAAEQENGEICVTGIGSYPSHGVKKGLIINMDSTVDAIRRAVEGAVVMSDIDEHNVRIGIAGSHLQGFQSSGAIPLSTREVRKFDVQSVLEAAKAIVIPTEREVIQIISQEYRVDDQDDIVDPLGMAGVRLESRVYIITGAISVARNIVKCMNRSGLKVIDMVPHHVASAEAVLTPDEKELGCAVLDIGGGTTDIAIFSRGMLRYCSTLPIGGNQITSDIAIGLRTPISQAEIIKKNFGHAVFSSDYPEHSITVASIGSGDERCISAGTLSRIIGARVEETLQIVRRELVQSGMIEHLAAGVVLTGGSSQLKGLSNMAEKILGLAIRTGFPHDIKGISDINCPECATAVGLLKTASTQPVVTVPVANRNARNTWGLGERMKHWFVEAF
jgi:cell division protein FtsA